METNDPAKAASIAELVTQPEAKQSQTPVVECIRRGRLQGIRTTMPDGTKLTIWQEAPTKRVGIDNVGRVVRDGKFGSLDMGGPRSH